MSVFTCFVGTVPANYDKYLGPVLFEPYALDIAERLQNDHLKNVLELACGTGRVTRHLHQLIPPDGHLTATDLNADMINVAKTIITGGTIQWQVADAMNLPFDDKQFDHVVCQFGVMFFPDKQHSFHEVYRVLQPGGKYLFNTWDEMKYNPGSDIIRNIMEEVLKDNPPDFLSKGPFSFYDQNEIKSLLEGAGFKNIQLEVVNKTGTCPTPQDYTSGFIYGSPLSAYLSSQEEGLRQRLEQQLIEGIAREFGEHDLKLPLQAIVCTANR